MQRFDTVHELDLTINIAKGIQNYKRFLEDTKKLTKCEVLVVRVVEIAHAFKPTMLHLLGKCTSVRKLVVKLSPPMFSLECPCHWQESSQAQNVMLGSLEEVEISDYGDVDYKLDLVRLLWRCSATFQKKVVDREYTMKKILSICPPNDKVEVNIVPQLQDHLVVIFQ
ncbi:hypothetical protein EJB05_31357, partial [Eragrostis curvula]